MRHVKWAVVVGLVALAVGAVGALQAQQPLSGEYKIGVLEPLTGNLATDLLNNRTKRIFNDKTGLAAAKSAAPFLLQRYQRDTGETMVDLSVPVFVRGMHWGAVRLGFRAVEAR